MHQQELHSVIATLRNHSYRHTQCIKCRQNLVTGSSLLSKFESKNFYLCRTLCVYDVSKGQNDVMTSKWRHTKFLWFSRNQPFFYRYLFQSQYMHFSFNRLTGTTITKIYVPFFVSCLFSLPKLVHLGEQTS